VAVSVDELRILSASGALGATPFDEDSFQRGLARHPHAIGADAGSNDVGPYGLGANRCYFPREWVKHDLRLMLLGARELGVPMLVGTAGHMGTDAGVDYHVSLIREIAREERLRPFRLARLYSELSTDTIRADLAAGRVEPLDGAPPLTPELIDATDHVVSVMGVEPYVAAFEQGAEVIIAGRSCDDAIFAAYPVYKGFDKALAIHLGKVLECASVAGTPYMARNAMLGTIRRDAIRFEPMNPKQRCTPVSVAAHSMYEEAHPHRHHIPGGVVHLEECTFTQVDERTVEVRGTVLEPRALALKVEGAGFVGYRVLGLVGIRDPLTIANLDAFLQFAREKVVRSYPQYRPREHYQVFTHVYGLNAMMQEREPLRAALPHEVGILVEVVSKDEAVASLMARLYRKSLMVAEYPGQKATTGKAGILADEELRGMDSYQWTICHAVRVDDPLAHTRIQLETVDGRAG
jgi:Acyclic terpene utilisation family protein AtuA